MSYTCPHCHGGFDEPTLTTEAGDGACPWCGTPIDGEYDPERFERVISRVRDDEPNKPEPLLPKLRRLFS